MASIEQRLSQEYQEAVFGDESVQEKREKKTNLRSKRRGRYVHLVDKSSSPSLLSNLSEVDNRGVSPETLDLVRELEKKRKQEKKDRVMRRRVVNAQRSKTGGKKG